MVISITSGSGYAGSVLTSDVSGGEWYADGVATGVTATTLTLTIALEGNAITYRVGGVDSNVVRKWVPADDPQALIYFDPSSGITITSSKVSAWANKLASNQTHSTSTVADRPVIGPSQQNGLDVVRLAENNLVGNYGNPFSGKPFTILSLIARNAAQGGDSYYFGGTADAAGRTLQIGWASDTSVRMAYYNNDANFPVAAFVSRAFELQTFQQTTSIRQFWQNAVSKGTNNNSTYLAQNDALSIGAAVRSSVRADNVDLAGIIGTASIDPAVIARHEGYLAWRYGLQSLLPSDHAYKAAAPDVFQTVIIDTIGSGNFTLPADWPGSGIVECLGSGGSSGGRFGGGGAAYARKNAFTGTAGSSVAYQVADGASEADTWFGSSTTVKAESGRNGVAGTAGRGGLAANSIGDAVFSGGSGGAGNTGSTQNGAGGGAAGPLGAGANGGTVGGNGGPGGGGANGGKAGASSVDANSAKGGDNYFGVGGGAAAGNNQPGNPGTVGGGGSGGDKNGTGGLGGASAIWRQNSDGKTAGPGGGGGGAGNSGGKGGNGGGNGGGGGAGTGSAANVGAGKPGVIILRYAPATGSVSAPGSTVTATSSLTSGAATAERNATATGGLLAATGSLIAGTASAATNGTAAGQTLATVASLAAGSASGQRNGSAAGQSVQAAAALLSGSASASQAGSAAGQIVTAAATLLAGSASGATNGAASGTTVSAASSLTSGAAQGQRNASAGGATQTSTVVLFPGSAAGQRNDTAAGAALAASGLLLPGMASGEANGNGNAVGASFQATVSLLFGQATGESVRPDVGDAGEIVYRGSSRVRENPSRQTERTVREAFERSETRRDERPATKPVVERSTIAAKQPTAETIGRLAALLAENRTFARPTGTVVFEVVGQPETMPARDLVLEAAPIVEEFEPALAASDDEDVIIALLLAA